MGERFLYRRKEFEEASEIFLIPRKTTVCNFSCEGHNGVSLASLGLLGGAAGKAPTALPAAGDPCGGT